MQSHLGIHSEFQDTRGWPCLKTHKNETKQNKTRCYLWPCFSGRDKLAKMTAFPVKYQEPSKGHPYACVLNSLHFHSSGSSGITEFWSTLLLWLKRHQTDCSWEAVLESYRDALWGLWGHWSDWSLWEVLEGSQFYFKVRSCWNSKHTQRLQLSLV